MININSRASKRAGSGINKGSLNPNITSFFSGTTATNQPRNPKTKDIMLDCTATASIVTYVYDGSIWRGG